MPDLAKLRDLESRLVEAEGASRELDGVIGAALRIKADHIPDWADENFPVWRGRPDGRVEVVHTDGKGGVHWEVPRYTESIDAALALIEEKLPGWLNSSIKTGENKYAAYVWQPRSAVSEYRAEDIRSTRAIAMLAALVRALIAMEQPVQEGESD